jgi:hypothetical protein
VGGPFEAAGGFAGAWAGGEVGVLTGSAAGTLVEPGGGTVVGGIAGGFVGRKVGSAAGSSAGNWVDRKLGLGDQSLCGGNCAASEKKEEDSKDKERAKQRAKDTANNPQQFEGQDKADVEKQLDQQLKDDAGWDKSPLNDGSGVKYTSPDGNQQLRLNDGYPGASDPLHSGPYLTSPSTNTRVPLQGNPALGQ